MADQPLSSNQGPKPPQRKIVRAAAEEPTASISRSDETVNIKPNAQARPASPAAGKPAEGAKPGAVPPARPAQPVAAGRPTPPRAAPAGGGANGAKPAAAAATQSVPPKAAAQVQRPVPTLPSAPAVGVRAELEEIAEQGEFLLALKNFVKYSPAWLASLLVHAVVLIVLGLLVIKIEQAVEQELVAEAIDPAENPIQDVQDVQFDQAEPLDLSQATESVQALTPLNEIVTEEPLSVVVDTAMATQSVDLLDFSDTHANPTDLLAEIGAFSGDAMSGRGDPKTKQALLAQYGGNEASEKAVAMALEWLARHQLPDGSWSFDHRQANHPNALDPGELDNARNAATGLALLPFLGAGMTHKQGKYKQTVHKGLYFLCSQMSPDGGLNGGGGRMYGHGICAFALCEAYAMTQDRSLRPYAERSLQFIVMAQDRSGGGWRYTPGQPGDTSVVGWQLMALKSGHMGYLKVPPQVIAGVNNFLNTVQSDGGATYGYTGPGRGPATTAIGLLCRMYLGWKQDNPALKKGVEFLSKMGPHKTNMYYNYYATQVLHHYEGELWYKWNEVMRDYLVNTQVKDGHEKGSWHFDGGHGAALGGRLYSTAMAAMTLEVYYRHLPIYRKQSTMDFAN